MLLSCQAAKSDGDKAQTSLAQSSQIEYIGQACDSIFVDSLLKEVMAAQLPKEERLLKIATAFVGKPYGVRTLEMAAPEALVVNTRALDCLTLVENVMALYRVTTSDQPNFKSYLKELSTIRYRNGQMGDYTTRLHYYSDWMTDNVDKQRLQNVTSELSGVEMQPQVGFMSKNPSKYKALSKHTEFVEVMAGHEARINAMHYTYIPKAVIGRIQSKIKTGDILGIVTNIKGLDMSHTGIAVNIDGVIYLLHASSSNKKVLLSEVSFVDYTMDISNQTGIVVLRIR